MAKGKQGKGGGAAEGGINLSAHPRARRDIGLAKGWGGLGAFVVVLVLSLRAGVPASDAVLRAVAGGFLGYLAAWGIAVSVWRHVALAEMERARRRLMEPPPDADTEASTS